MQFHFALLAIALVSVLARDDGPTELHSQLQLMSMERLVGIETCNNPGAALIGLRLQGKPAVPKLPCQWKGVDCDGSIVTKINWENTEDTMKHRRYSFYLLVSMRWIPQTVEGMFVSKQHIDSQVDTRFLPRCLKQCRMNSCGIEGEFGMEDLPNSLEELFCRDNAISGIMRLTALPNSVRIIDMSENAIQRVIVCNHDLPEGMKYCLFERMKRRFFRFQSIDHSSTDPRIWTQRPDA